MLYAIGDVHGHFELLLDLVDQIHAWHRTNASARPAHLITLGDYIDRGPDSRQVIEFLMEGIPGFEKRIHIKGNHEVLMIETVLDELPGTWTTWEYDGGGTTLESYDYYRGGTVPKFHVEWMEKLPLFYIHGDFCFCHAGILPGKPLDEQLEKDFLWIREAFLESKIDHGYRIVHGHTPTFRPKVEVHKNRINVDTGAYMSGVLSAIGIDPSKPKNQRPTIFAAGAF